MVNNQACRYVEECHGVGIKQCPECQSWYCADCVQSFSEQATLPPDTLLTPELIYGPTVDLVTPICSECHYRIYGKPWLDYYTKQRELFERA